MPRDRVAEPGALSRSSEDEDSLDLSVVIVTYRNSAVIEECLGAVMRSRHKASTEVIVVDNASPDNTAEVARSSSPNAVVLVRDVNGGFADGCAAGAHVARGRSLLFLNPDTVIGEDAIDALLRCSTEHPAAGVVGGRFVHHDGSTDMKSWWRRPSLWSACCFALGLSTLLPGNRYFDPEAARPWSQSPAEVRDAPVVSGALMLVRRELWDRLGGFDRSFFIYGEDADFCIRAARAGYRPLVTAQATCQHIGGKSSTSLQKLIMLFTGKCTLARRQFAPGTARVVIGLLLTGVFVRSVAGRWRRLGALAHGHRPVTSAGDWAGLWSTRHQWRSGWPGAQAR